MGSRTARGVAWTELMARCMTLAGVRPGMLIHNANTYGLFTGGHGFHQGAERIGAPVVPVSGGMATRQAMLLHDLGAQVLVSTPSYAIVVGQAVQDAGIDPGVLAWLLGQFPVEPLPIMIEPLTTGELVAYRDSLRDRFKAIAVPSE